MTKTTARTPTHVEVWYQIQYSRTGADDWYPIAYNSRFESAESASAQIEKWKRDFAGCRDRDYRIIRKVLTQTVVEPEGAKK